VERDVQAKLTGQWRDTRRLGRPFCRTSLWPRRRCGAATRRWRRRCTLLDQVAWRLEESAECAALAPLGELAALARRAAAMPPSTGSLGRGPSRRPRVTGACRRFVAVVGLDDPGPTKPQLSASRSGRSCESPRRGWAPGECRSREGGATGRRLRPRRVRHDRRRPALERVAARNQPVARPDAVKTCSTGRRGRVLSPWHLRPGSSWEHPRGPAQAKTSRAGFGHPPPAAPVILHPTEEGSTERCIGRGGGAG
jgi:hypothetical protein